MGAYFDHGWWSLLIYCAVSGAVAAMVLRLLLTRLREFALDAPNHRSLHETPVPRTGGWGLLTGTSVGLLLSQPEFQPGIVFAFIALLLVSVADDLRSLSARLRFSVQILSVMVLLYSLALPFVTPLSWVIWPLLVLTGVWVVNLYNFMDGMDGFAGSMTAIGFAALGAICFLRNVPQIGIICLLVATSSVVFLYYNWPRAQIFLGDAGSTVIGLAVFAVSVAGWQQGAFGLVVPLLIFLPFWLDATVTLIIRMLRRERWWEAHRQHFYQRMALKHGVKTSLFIEVAVMVSTSLLALVLVASGVA
ncbi:MraY family glycosyltransferase [Microbulbifer sp. ARAS458-1]|uniref:MraY family glycosyltransferase n=1 Tax=Microbulbifer sp. ARAS458-1 TaxID=3140242 RepID=UPI003877EDFC